MIGKICLLIIHNPAFQLGYKAPQSTRRFLLEKYWEGGGWTLHLLMWLMRVHIIFTVQVLLTYPEFGRGE